MQAIASFNGLATGMAMDQTELNQVADRLGHVMAQGINNRDLVGGDRNHPSDHGFREPVE